MDISGIFIPRVIIIEIINMIRTKTTLCSFKLCCKYFNKLYRDNLSSQTISLSYITKESIAYYSNVRGIRFLIDYFTIVEHENEIKQIKDFIKKPFNPINSSLFVDKSNNIKSIDIICSFADNYKTATNVFFTPEEFFLPNFPNLESLTMKHMLWSGKLFPNFRLKSLHIDHCEMIDYANIEKLTMLEELTLGRHVGLGSSIFDTCKRRANAGLTNHFHTEKMISLRKLSLIDWDPDWFDPSEYLHIDKSIMLTKICLINIDEQLTIKANDALIEKILLVPNLKSLTISAHDMDNHTFTKIISCPTLRKLCLINCDTIRMRWFKALDESLPIQIIKITNCKLILNTFLPMFLCNRYQFSNGAINSGEGIISKSCFTY